MMPEGDASIPKSNHAGKRRQPYRAYLLRCWYEEAAPGEEPLRRFSVEEIPQRGPRRGFSDLKALLAFLEEGLGEKPPERGVVE